MPPDTFITFIPDRQDPSWRSGWDPMVALAEQTPVPGPAPLVRPR